MNDELKLFNNYYNKFKNLKEKEIEEKYYHTKRVVNYAEVISISLNLNEEDIKKAKICALFHDIGRFEQWGTYHTFDDRKSFDHGDKAYEILKSMNYNDEIVLKAVKYHNKFSIPNNLTDREKLFAKITRDADKLDIMSTQCNSLKDKKYILTKEIENAFKEERQLRNENVQENSSMLGVLRCIAFIFDINYKKSFEIIKKEKIVDKKFDMLYKEFRKDEILKLKRLCDNYIEGKINENIEKKKENKPLKITLIVFLILLVINYIFILMHSVLLKYPVNMESSIATSWPYYYLVNNGLALIMNLIVGLIDIHYLKKLGLKKNDYILSLLISLIVLILHIVVIVYTLVTINIKESILLMLIDLIVPIILNIIVLFKSILKLNN